MSNVNGYILNKIKNKNTYKNFCFFMIGLFINTLSINLFYIPNNVVSTGSTGLAILINNFIDIPIPLIVFVISSILLLIGFMVFGMEYGAKTILGTILFPLFLEGTSIINNFVSFDNTSLFLLILIGSVINGFGFGLVKKSGYSMGGFFVLYDLMKRIFKISIGKASLICNSLIIIFGVFIFGLDKCIYALIAIYISTYVGDRVMLGVSRNKAFYIITNKPYLIKDYIINNLNHTVTIVAAKGGYSDKRKKILLCVIPTTEYTRLKEIIKELDKNAFFLITDSYSVSKQ